MTLTFFLDTYAIQVLVGEVFVNVPFVSCAFVGYSGHCALDRDLSILIQGESETM